VPGVRAWRRRSQTINFAFVFAETIEGLLPVRVPIVSLFVTLFLQMGWIVRNARRTKREARRAATP